MQTPNRNTIFIVYLAPELESTLGSLIGGKHYVAYHNFMNLRSGRLHYVVIPFQAEVRLAQEIATRAFVSAALNPQ